MLRHGAGGHPRMPYRYIDLGATLITMSYLRVVPGVINHAESNGAISFTRFSASF